MTLIKSVLIMFRANFVTNALSSRHFQVSFMFNSLSVWVKFDLKRYKLTTLYVKN